MSCCLSSCPLVCLTGAVAVGESISVRGVELCSVAYMRCQKVTRAHHRDEKPERDLTYHLTCLLIYHGTTTHL